MKPAPLDQFLGAWSLREWVYDAQGELLGTIEQRRELLRTPDSERLEVVQHCKPSPDLRSHAMGQFAGEFRFNLQRDGAQRFYEGPDVHGSATSLGGIYLSGQGVWPRFGYNFRSWSISLGKDRQITGGSFFRGESLAAIVFGIGHAEGAEIAMPEPPVDAGPRPMLRGEALSTDSRGLKVQKSHVRREAHTKQGWIERWEGLDGDPASLSEQHYEWTPVGKDLLLRRNGVAVGMARTYGPLFVWELHGPQGAMTSGLECTDPWQKAHCALRRHFQNGNLVLFEGLQLDREGESL